MGQMVIPRALPHRRNLRPHQRRVPPEAALRRLQAAFEVVRVPEPSPAEMHVLRAVFAAAWQAFRERPWTVAALVDVGAVSQDESRSAGRLLARCAGHRAQGFELVRAGECREGLRWRLRVLR